MLKKRVAKMKYELYNKNCLDKLKDIPDKSIDMILCDPPYGTTASKWDCIIPFEKLWEQLERIIKPSSAIVLFASGQFTIQLINSNYNLYKYKWIWQKNTRGNFVNAKNRPMTAYEEICVFSRGNTANGSKIKMNYYPQGLESCYIKRSDKSGTRFGTMAGKRPSQKAVTIQKYTNYPCDVLNFETVPHQNAVHPNEKPVKLLEYLINTYTKENETVLDFAMGSGSTGVACVNTNRNFVGIELLEKYFTIAKSRIESTGNSKERENE